MADAHLDYHRTLHLMPRNARCPTVQVTSTYLLPFLVSPEQQQKNKKQNDDE